MREVPEYYAGNRVTVDRTFSRLPESVQSVNPSTVDVWVNHPDGTTTLLTTTPTYPGDGVSQVYAIAAWTVPADTPQGKYIFSFRVTGNLIARDEVPVFIIAVTRPEPPTS